MRLVRRVNFEKKLPSAQVFASKYIFSSDHLLIASTTYEIERHVASMRGSKRAIAWRQQLLIPLCRGSAYSSTLTLVSSRARPDRRTWQSQPSLLVCTQCRRRAVRIFIKIYSTEITISRRSRKASSADAIVPRWRVWSTPGRGQVGSAWGWGGGTAQTAQCADLVPLAYKVDAVDGSCTMPSTGAAPSCTAAARCAFSEVPVPPKSVVAPVHLRMTKRALS
jgi:hypothetical protein